MEEKYQYFQKERYPYLMGMLGNTGREKMEFLSKDSISFLGSFLQFISKSK